MVPATSISSKTGEGGDAGHGKAASDTMSDDAELEVSDRNLATILALDLLATSEYDDHSAAKG